MGLTPRAEGLRLASFFGISEIASDTLSSKLFWVAKLFFYPSQVFQELNPRNIPGTVGDLNPLICISRRGGYCIEAVMADT
jgi:hypothetical protein